MLVGIACSDQISDVADAAVAAITADDVSYGTDSTVAAAIADLEQSLAGNHQSLTDVEDRLLLVEADLVDCKAGLEDTKSSLEIAKTDRETLEGRLSAVETAHEATDSELGTLAETVEAPFTCPAGTVKGFSSCVDSSPTKGTFWLTANQQCLQNGGHLCSVSEYLDGCFHFVNDEGPMMTGELIADGQVLTVDIADVTGCIMSLGTATLGTLDVPYRCCRDLGLDWAKEE
ncbi:MAG: hypothetical protein ACI9OJ_002106 [Myxococcota bacterium]